MSKKIFVGGLSWNTDEGSLQQAFEAFGAIEDVHVVVDRETGRSRGFAFITFSDEGAAAKAIDEMNGQELDGRNLAVNEAQERGRRPSRY